MNENNDLLPNLLHEEFEMQMRGYSRRQVDDFVARRNNEVRELEQRLAQALDDSERLRRELGAVRQQALAGRPAHEEVSERIAQILKLADDEAMAQKSKADEDVARLRGEAQQEAERARAGAREQVERMLTAAQEQAERTISTARNEADDIRTAARTEADRLTGDIRKQAEAALANAQAQAKKMLDEATARATAIHDGAERRLNLLSTRHTDTVRRLTDILDGVQGLVAAEAARLSLEEEVNQSVAKAVGMADPADGGQPGDDGDPGLAQPPANQAAVGARPPAPDTRQGRPVQPAPPPAAPQVQQGDTGRQAIPLPSGPPRPGPPIPGAAPSGPGTGLPPDRNASPGQSQTGLIDPDEPTEGLRLRQ